MPVMRAMALAFPGNALTRGYETQFMCGDALLVAPIVQRRAAKSRSRCRPGAWYDLNSRQRFPGRRVLRYKAALDQFPVFGREGYALPLGPRGPAHRRDRRREAARAALGVRQADAAARRLRAGEDRRGGATAPTRSARVADVKVELFGDAAGIVVASCRRRRRCAPPTIAITRASPPASGRSSSRCSRSVIASARSRRGSSSSATATLLRARAARIGLAPRYADYDRRVARAAPAARRSLAPAAGGAGDAGTARTRPTRTACSRCCSARADACATGAFAALVTAPVQKSVLMDAGIPFAGHTEFFAQRTHTPRVVMLLVGGARGRAAARRARHDAPRAEGRAGGDHARSASTRRSRSSPRSSRAKFGIAVAAHRRLRPQSARRRGRAPRPRGDRRHRAGDRRAARRRPRRDRPAARRHGVRARRSRAASTRSSRCTTTRDCRC